MTATDERAAELASIAMQLADRIRDEDPNDVARWLNHELPTHRDVRDLCFILAAAVPVDVTFTRLTAWTQHDGDPVANQRQAILTAPKRVRDMTDEERNRPKRSFVRPGDHADTIRQLKDDGKNYTEIAAAIGCSRDSIRRFLLEEKAAA